MKSLENRIYSTFTHIVLGALSFLALFPFLVLFVSSFSSESSIVSYGYSFIPRDPSLEAYSYLWLQKGQIFRAYGITVIVTAIGTAVCLLVTIHAGLPFIQDGYARTQGVHLHGLFHHAIQRWASYQPT